VTSRVSTPQ